MKKLVFVLALLTLSCGLAQSYEYALVSLAETGAVSWASADTQVNAAEGFISLAKELGADISQARGNDFVFLLNFLGSQGWRLLEIDLTGREEESALGPVIRKEYLFVREQRH